MANPIFLDTDLDKLMVESQARPLRVGNPLGSSQPDSLDLQRKAAQRNSRKTSGRHSHRSPGRLWTNPETVDNGFRPVFGFSSPRSLPSAPPAINSLSACAPTKNLHFFVDSVMYISVH